MKTDQKFTRKGLSALLGEITEADSARKPIGYVNKALAGTDPEQKSSDIVMVKVDDFETNPHQPRLEFDEKSIQELAQSIKSLGLIQPIVARKTGDGHYQIISGERRWRACKSLGMELVPAYVRDASDESMLEMAIVENLQREDLDPIEIAMSFRSLMDECKLTQEEMADKLGSKRASVANYLRLLKLSDKVQHDLRQGLLSVGHAKVLLKVSDSKLQQKLSDLVIKENLTVRELEEKLTQDDPENYKRLASTVGRFCKGKISFHRNASGKGSITIRFNSDSEVERFIKLLDN